MNYNTTRNQPLYTPQQQWVFSAQGVTQMDKGCVATRAPGHEWECFFAEANLPYITTPLFATQDMVDSWQMPNILQLGCNPNTNCNAAQIQAMDAFRDSMLVALAPITDPATPHGGFLSTCYQHCHQNIASIWDRELVPLRGGGNTTVQESFWAWYSGGSGKVVAVDGEWGANPQCCGTASRYCSAAKWGAL